MESQGLFSDKDFHGLGQQILRKLTRLSKEQFISSARNILRKKHKDDMEKAGMDGEKFYKVKVLFSLGTYAIYDSAKLYCRESLLNDLELQLTNNQINLQHALVQILTSYIGESDLDSFKFLLIHHLFNVAADSHKDAETIVKVVIIACQSDTDIALSTIPSKSNKR